MRKDTSAEALHEGQIRKALSELVKFGLDDRYVGHCRIASVPLMFSDSVGPCPSADLTATDPKMILRAMFKTVYDAGFQAGQHQAEYDQMQGLVQAIPGLEKFVTDLAEQVADKVIDQRLSKNGI
ncbi:hypothetical protein [Mesorhizobium sp. SP-1A]|uniref:hypothetical protein n=1 Tax=Mesorhizobium sp. SP-1A TaxID=3077840 RepID=UPI0028F6F28D|nr:hypothetical protein [Mesorhizobium sp. SP-1A]